MKKLLVALSVLDFYQCMVEAGRILKPNGAHGVLLVNNNLHIKTQPDDVLANIFEIARSIKQKYPNHIVGVNPVGMKNYNAIINMVDLPVDVLWVDDGGINERLLTISLDHSVENVLRHFDFTTKKYFGGIKSELMFDSSKLLSVAKFSAENFKTVMLNGLYVDQAPALGTVKEVKKTVGNCPIVVSGMNLHNVENFLNYADFFISSNSALLVNKLDPFIYDEDLVKKMRAEIDRFENNSGYVC